MSNFVKPVHFQLLCKSVQVHKTNALREAEQLLSNNPVDWEEILLRAEINAVKPQLQKLLKQISPGLVPTYILEKLHTANRENLYQQLQNIAEYLQVKKMLDVAGIPAILFKGFSLANDFYDNLADRESVDVDLFIHPSDLEKIKPLMRQRGYVAEEPLEQLTDEFIFRELCEYNFDKYAGERRIFHIEFHWRLSMAVFGMDISLAELQPQVITRFIQHTPVPVFSPSAHLLLVIMHHGGKDQFLQLKQVLDISKILDKENLIDWNWVTGTAEKYHVEKVLFVAINLCSKLTGTTIPPVMLQKVRSKEINLLARNRISRMTGKKDRKENVWVLFDDFLFRLRTRNNLSLRAKMVSYEIRKNFLPGMIPKKFHRFLLNKKIRKAAVN